MPSRDVELDLIGSDHTGHATRSAANNLDRLRAKMNRFNVDSDSGLKKKFAASGLRAASAFAQSFTRVISGGLLGRGTIGMAAKMNPVFAVLGVAVGAVFAAKIVAAVGQGVQAGLPLVLAGVIVAGPFIHLAKTQKGAVDKLKGQWKSFADFVSKPLTVPFLATLKEVGAGLERLKKPFAALTKAIGPALAPFTKGVFDGIIGFIDALKPAMPGITAGLKEWGKQLPKIGKALGDAFAKILENPDQVRKSVEGISKLITDVIAFVAGFVTVAVALGNGIELVCRSITTAIYTMVIGALSAIAGLLDAWATINPRMKGPAKAVHGILAGVQSDFQATKDKWTATAREMAQRAIVAKITATIDDLETKIAAAKAKLKTVKDAKTRAKIEATIKDLEAKAASAKRRLLEVKGAKTEAKIKAIIKELEAKVAAAKAKLKTVHDAKTQAKIKAEISQLQAAAARARAELASIRGKTVTVNLRTVKYTNSVTLKGGKPAPNLSAGDGWEGAAGGSYRTGGPRVVLGDTNVDSRVFIDGRELRAMARSTVIDETRRNAHRARVGRR